MFDINILYSLSSIDYSSESAFVIALLVAATGAHVVRSTVRIRLACRNLIIVRVVVRSASSIRCELVRYFLYLLDPGRVRALPDIDEIVVRYFPEHKEYQEL